MESLSVLDIYKKIKERGLIFLDYAVLSKLTGYSNKNTLYKISQKLENKKVLKRLAPGLFLFTESSVSEFEIANFVYQPSYVSLETALSFYGILSQFPYTLTSVTTRKSKKVLIEEKEYTYSKMDLSLFWGYERKNDMLIASPEKAFLDTIYFASKGISRINLADLDLSVLNKVALITLAKKFNSDLILNKIKEITR